MATYLQYYIERLEALNQSYFLEAPNTNVYELSMHLRVIAIDGNLHDNRVTCFNFIDIASTPK